MNALITIDALALGALIMAEVGGRDRENMTPHTLMDDPPEGSA
jgi:hypothetical protein